MARTTKKLPVNGPSPAEQVFHRVDQRYRTIRAFGKYGVVAFSIWNFRVAIEALAGQETGIYIQAGLSLLADIRFSALITLSCGLGLWGAIERRLRQKTILRLHDRVKKLEVNVDPSRSSSNLTQTGKTNPKDWES